MPLHCFAFREGIFPNTQPEPPLVQLESVISPSITSLYDLGWSTQGPLGDTKLLPPSRTSCCPCSTEASPELCARIIESLIVASEAAEVPAAPGK